jgi:hypothetical protein
MLDRARRGKGVASGPEGTGYRPFSRRKWVEALGIEARESVGITAIPVDSRTNDPSRVDVSARSLVAFGPEEIQSPIGVGSPVEDMLARAIERASAAGRWDVVAQLARELEARRLRSADIADLRVRRERKMP